MQNLTKLLLISLILIFASCEKEEVFEQKQSEELPQEPLLIDSLSLVAFENDSIIIEESRMAYWDSLPQIEKNKLDSLIGAMSKWKPQIKKTVDAWGVGWNNRVFRYIGGIWHLVGGGLVHVAVGSYGDGVWGITHDNRILKYNEVNDTWFEPLPGVGAGYITAFSSDVAMVIAGYNSRLFITYNGGASWTQFGSITNVKELSVGNQVFNFAWLAHHGGQLKRYNIYSHSWEIVSHPGGTVRHLSAMHIGGVWTLDNTFYGTISPGLVRKSINDGATFTTPNPQGSLYFISSNDDLNAWGVGWDSRVFRTNNGGASWYEPNPGMGLYRVYSN